MPAVAVEKPERKQGLHDTRTHDPAVALPLSFQGSFFVTALILLLQLWRLTSNWIHDPSANTIPVQASKYDFRLFPILFLSLYVIRSIEKQW